MLCGVTVAGLALTVTACDTSPGSSGGGGKTPTSLTIDMGFTGTTIQQNFNPYSPNAVQGTDGYLYETLFGFDEVDSAKFVPWLASSIDWADGGDQLTIHLDPRATWSNGAKLTSADVVYTFQATTKAGVALVTYKTITAPDPETVVLTFAKPAYTQLYDMSQMFILPKAIWAHENISTWTNPDPIASGPYTLTRYSPQQLTLTARPGYWKQSVPVKTLYAPIISQATGVLPQLLSGAVGWSGGAVPNVMKSFVAKGPDNHAWWPSYGALFLYLNLKRAPFGNVHVREGISLAIDRQELSQIVDDGLSYPINLTGMDQKTQTGWIEPSLLSDIQDNAADSQALAQFAQAGYHEKGGALIGPNGQQLTFAITEVSTFANSVQRDQLICQQLAAVGIKCSVQTVPSTTQVDDRTKGDFDALTGGVVYGVTPYDFYNTFLNGGLVGNANYYNYEGFSDPAVNSALQQMTQTGNKAQLEQLSATIEQAMATQLPVIPLSDIGVSAEWSTSQWVGWPSASDPYAEPAPWAGPPDMINILLHLRPAS
jgi:peptide/nickel transport system substrate-binding protein